jgi:hypothetical protein
VSFNCLFRKFHADRHEVARARHPSYVPARAQRHLNHNVPALLAPEAQFAGIPFCAVRIVVLVQRLEIGNKREGQRVGAREERQRLGVRFPFSQLLGVGPRLDELEEGVLLFGKRLSDVRRTLLTPQSAGFTDRRRRDGIQPSGLRDDA